MPHPSQQQPARLWSLDALRGLCALVVFLNHWHVWSGFAPRGSFETAVHTVGQTAVNWFSDLCWPLGGHHPAVIGFFVLSGFCIHYPFERRVIAGTPAPAWRDYFRRRFWRIAPVYWIACLLGLVFVFAERRWPTHNDLLVLHQTATPLDVVVRFLGLAGVYPREIFAGNYILTTVDVELLMYALYPWFFRVAARGAWGTLGVAFVAAQLLVIQLLRVDVSPFWVFNSIFMLGLFWYMGAYAAHLFLHGRDRVRVWHLLAAWAGFIVLKNIPHFYGLTLLTQAACALVCTLGILLVLRGELRSPALREHPLMRALRYAGDLSYTLYAVHTPIIMLVAWTLLHLGRTDYLLQLAAILTSVSAVVLAVHYGVERRFYQPRSA